MTSHRMLVQHLLIVLCTKLAPNDKGDPEKSGCRNSRACINKASLLLFFGQRCIQHSLFLKCQAEELHLLTSVELLGVVVALPSGEDTLAAFWRSKLLDPVW